MKALPVIILLQKISIRIILYAVVAIIVLNGILMLYSRELNRQFIRQTIIADRLLFEAKLPHDFSIRDADIALRGYALSGEESFLFATIPRVRLEIERSFDKVDSVLNLQGFKSEDGLAKIETYKREIRAFNDHQYALVNLIRSGNTDLFMENFKSDAGSNLYPSFVDAIEEVNTFELAILTRYEFLLKLVSISSFWLQVVTLVLVAPLLLYVSRRISKQREEDMMKEEFRVKTEINNTKEEMLSILSHEIRTPLNSMIGLTHVLARRDPRPDQKEVIRTLEASGDHLMHMVNDILDYNKIQAERLTLEQVPFTLSDVLRQVHSMFYRIAEENGVEFAVKVESSIPQFLIGDSNRLIQILNNLIGNALKFTSVGRVNLNVRLITRDDNGVILRIGVEDTGIGIHEKEIDNIFLPFSQERSIQGKFGGTGLGLTIVKKLVELMTGNITVSSLSGKGSTFTVTLPFGVDESQFVPIANGEENISSNSALKGRRVLYVEDVASNRFLVNSILEDYAVACDNAENGEEGLVLIRKNKYDVILLDIQLPDMSGYEVCQFIRNDSASVNKTTPIILFTAFSNISQEEVERYRANDLLGKPFKTGKLIEKMEALVIKGDSSSYSKNA